MNKKLIAAAIAAVVAAPAVSAADTTLYGKAHVSIQSNDNGATDNYSVNSNASRLGVKGSEDLGDGLKAIFGYEMGYDITDGGANGPISARNAYVGLAGGFGTVLAGRHDTPAKIAFYAAGTDFVGDSIVDMNNVAGKGTFTENRLDNAIAYVSPSFSGFTFAAAIVPGEGTGKARTTVTTSNTPGNGLNDAYSLGLMYAGGGLKATLGYEVATQDYINNLLPTTTTALATADQKMWQLGVSYTFGDFTIGGNYEKDSDYAGANGIDRTAWGIAGKANFGNNYVVVNYANTDGDTGVALANADGYGLAVGHVFSKRTQVYAAYHATDYDASTMQDKSAFALGMIHSF